ncbi:DNA polymerase Y family protein [Piscinibacter sakaiensis]|uniref:Y-family DNA polymerase n=1 Tax=Piscinibacter sakaiensis TaxID=1547922 RepID=UPI0037297C48
MPALARLGLDPAALVIVHTRARTLPGTDSLWALEQSLRRPSGPRRWSARGRPGPGSGGSAVGAAADALDRARPAAAVTGDAAQRAGGRRGVQPGQKRATALALAPRLHLAVADPARDAQALQAVAHAALAFTPMVCVAPPRTVLLEVQSSLRCFGGFEALLARLDDTLRPLGHRVHWASAPTPQGAALLAHEAEGPGPARARRRLAVAPVWRLGPGREHWEALEGMGLRCIGDLLTLPRSGLARRFGEALLHELDRALGQPPPVFDARLELLARADTTDQVLQGAQRLLAPLLAWARARQGRVQRLRLSMLHERRHRSDWQDQGPTVLDLGLAQPSDDAAHLGGLLRERLAHVQLAAPTLELRLECRDLVHQPAPHPDLFPGPAQAREGWTRLIERLQARLGADQVQRLAYRPDHRPEQAQPQPLVERERRPWLEGRPLTLVAGPERVEAGWWDGGLAARDYYVAVGADGALVWVYRSRLPPDDPAAPVWFLQGWYG